MMLINKIWVVRKAWLLNGKNLTLFQSYKMHNTNITDQKEMSATFCEPNSVSMYKSYK